MHRGRGAPPLAFVHGFACSHEDWREQLAFFAPAHEVVACDLRGHGATPGRRQECTIGHYGGDVAALLSHLDLQRCILVGHSMGCRVVLEAARLDPERVAGLVLIDGSRLTAAAQQGVADYAAFVEAFFRQMTADEAIVQRARRLPAAIGTALWQDLTRWDAGAMEAALGALRAPLLVIQSTFLDAAGQRRSLAPGQSSPWLDFVRATAPAARIEIVSGAGHFVQLDAPAEVNRLVGEFLSAVTALNRR